MKHLGDICKINGAEIEPVDCITGGSPCQDLSIAGKRAGLAGERSGLFLEQIRVVKEMRDRDKRAGRTGDMVRPRFLVWENVYGAFSSNGGKDFARVIEEIIKIVEPEAPSIEVPEKGWSTWGGYHDCMGGRWSVAWRTHDAQYWGVPQRRRRISVVADFGGDAAAEVLFERRSVSGNTPESGTAWERPSGSAENGASYAVRIRGGCDGGGKGALVQEDKSGTLGTGNDQTIFCLQGNGIDRADTAGCNGKGWREDVCYTLNTIDRPAVCAGFKLGNSEQARSIGYAEEQAPTLNAECGGNKPAVVAPAVALDMTHACDVIRECGEIVPSLQARMGTGGNQVPLAFGIGNGQACEAASMAAEKAQTLNTMHDPQAVFCPKIAKAIKASGRDPHREDAATYITSKATVRRLTPLECERLQSFPDGWTDIGKWRDSKGKLHKSADNARYKALGNSIALPFWDFLAKRISAQYIRPIKIGSLFDGIGGFPLVFERYNGKGSARWASEIEEFPMAVTKLRFPEGET